MTSFLFIDRDGTLIKEPTDFQIDSIEKFELLDEVIPSLIQLSLAGFKLVMITNQDGLGTASNPQDKFDMIQNLLMGILNSQGIKFEEILICPHIPEENCNCRKPKTQLVKKHLSSNEMNRESSYVIGDRSTDIELAENMGLKSFLISKDMNWKKITHMLLNQPRTSLINRKTKETEISVELDLDGGGQNISIATGIGFFDHMLEQLARHGSMNLNLKAIGDLHIDQHHLVEDVAITLGQAIKKALGEKRGIARFGFLLPMDEASTQSAVDLSGRAHFSFNNPFTTAHVGELSVEMIPHFFKSLAESIGMSMQLETKGENNHHMVESMFKSVGRSLAQAFKKTNSNADIPSTKGIL
jgi:imidazoleglycerol-phosphate dehydratase / histidinol-phosphatase